MVSVSALGACVAVTGLVLRRRRPPRLLGGFDSVRLGAWLSSLEDFGAGLRGGSDLGASLDVFGATCGLAAESDEGADCPLDPLVRRRLPRRDRDRVGDSEGWFPPAVAGDADSDFGDSGRGVEAWPVSAGGSFGFSCAGLELAAGP